MVSLLVMREIWSAASLAWHSPALDSYLRSALRVCSARLLDPFCWVLLALVSVLQLVWCAQRDKRRLFSPAPTEDKVGVVCSTLFVVAVLGASLAQLNVAYQHLTGGLPLNLSTGLGIWGLAGVGLVLADVLAWYRRWLDYDVATCAPSTRFTTRRPI